jgi:hypothetical protein
MRGTSYWDDLKHLQSSKIGQATRSRRPGSPTATRLWPREGGLQNTKRLNSNLSSPRASGHRSSFRGAKSEARAPLSSLFHVFFGKFPPLRGLFTNLRESIKEAKSINQPDAKPGIKKPRPEAGPAQGPGPRGLPGGSEREFVVHLYSYRNLAFPLSLLKHNSRRDITLP